MFRRALESLRTLSLRTRSTFTRQVRGVSYGLGEGDEELEAEYLAARKWISELNIETIPKSVARATFVRSSGPGGQKVNKTNSKAVVNWPLESIKPYVPKILHTELRQSRFYVASSDTLQMSAQSSRNQRANKDECHEKLHELLKDLGKRCIPGKTMESKRSRVKKLEKEADAYRLGAKRMRKAKKQARRTTGRDD